ncbi:hypothetical protein PoB_003551500 [Plakobranchus ocellatus]|uniref:Uncharacterized protein n=1 Tax=Plakobranchus ocellatus TaxID=259542 RepID=A0AAV4ALF7_9GAST|nr:hypothetical protein PoB_003551500 [Plakobranchus ocellatus]
MSQDHLALSGKIRFQRGREKVRSLKMSNQTDNRKRWRRGVTASASSQPSHTITCSMFPWDDRGDGHPSDTTLLNTLAPVLVAHELLTHGTTKLPLPATKRTKN